MTSDDYLNKARIKYKDAVRGYEYQKKLLNEIIIQERKGIMFDEIEYSQLEFRKNKFLAEICIIEDIFGMNNVT